MHLSPAILGMVTKSAHNFSQYMFFIYEVASSLWGTEISGKMHQDLTPIILEPMSIPLNVKHGSNMELPINPEKIGKNHVRNMPI